MDFSEVLRHDVAKEMKLQLPAGENNWKSRQTFCLLLSESIDAHGKSASINYMETIEPFLNNIIDCAVSERTTLSIQGCRLLGNLPKVLGKDIHPLLDRLLPILIRVCASTKSVSAKGAAKSVSNIIHFSTYNSRLLWHVCQAFEDKYAGPKTFAPEWLTQIMEEHSKSMHPDREYDAIATAIRHGLEDADNTVRTKSRATYWAYHKLDVAGAERITEGLNNHAKIALTNDPHNPDKQNKKSSKKEVKSDPALIQIREQAKKRMQQAAAQRNITPQSITSLDFPAGMPLDSDIHIPSRKPDTKPPTLKSRPAEPMPGAKLPQQVPTEPEHLYASKMAARMNAAQHKKTASQESELPKSSLSSSSSSRGLLSAPLRRPRIVATPINVPQSNRPPSRTGHAHKDLRPVSSSSETKLSISTASSNVEILSTSSVAGSAEEDARLKRALARAKPKVIYDGHDQDLTIARRYADTALTNLRNGTIDPLGFRKLRNFVIQFPGSLITQKDLYDGIFEEILARLHGLDKLAGQIDTRPIETNPVYNRHVILEMIPLLLACYPAWSQKWIAPVTTTLVLFRTTLSANVDGDDRRVEPVVKVMNQVLKLSTNSLDLVDRITTALAIGEETILRFAPDNPDPAGTWSSYDPYTLRGRLFKHCMDTVQPMEDADAFDYFNQHNFHHVTVANCHEEPVLPNKIPLLFDFGLQILEIVLIFIHEARIQIPDDQAENLGELAAHCFKAYSHVIKRNVIQFCRILYKCMDDDQFFSYFEESEKNLITYYLANQIR